MLPPRANAVRLQFIALVYNPTNFLRTLALPEEVKRRSLTTPERASPWAREK